MRRARLKGVINQGGFDMRIRTGLVAMVLCAAAVAVPSTAAAQEPPGFTQVVPVTGKGGGGKQFSGTYAIDRFRTSSGELIAVGTLRGRLGQRRVVERGVTMPAALSADAEAAQLPPIPNACEILNLVLGPIRLDLLGLVIRTNRINVRIDAVPGPGNLLGNLLCAITGLLDPQATSARQQAPALNAILALVPRTG
jgi:hypothetical protein